MSKSPLHVGQTVISKVNIRDSIQEGEYYLIADLHYIPGTKKLSAIKVFDNGMKDWLLFLGDFEVSSYEFDLGHTLSPSNLKDLLEENKALKVALQKEQFRSRGLLRKLNEFRDKMRA